MEGAGKASHQTPRSGGNVKGQLEWEHGENTPQSRCAGGEPPPAPARLHTQDSGYGGEELGNT